MSTKVLTPDGKKSISPETYQLQDGTTRHFCYTPGIFTQEACVAFVQIIFLPTIFHHKNYHGKNFHIAWQMTDFHGMYDV